MKAIKFIITAMLSLTMVGGVQAQDKKKDAEVTFSVNMNCEHCKKKIMSNIPHEKGVTDMKADLPKNEVWIKYNPGKTDKEKLQKAIEKLGYTATEVVPEDKGKGEKVKG